MKTHTDPRYENTLWSIATIHIRRNSDLETVSFNQSIIVEDGEPSIYIWEEGNFSCDCNRHNFFCIEKFGDSDDIDCSDGLYSVNIFDDEGNCIYREFE